MENAASGTAPKREEPSVQVAAAQPAVIIKSGESSRMWEMISLLVPALLAAYLTFLSGRSENKIKESIENQTLQLSAQLQLNEELYKRRIDTYDQLYKELKSLDLELQDRVTANSAGTSDLLTKFSQARGMNELHMSDDVSKLMLEAWKAGVRGDPEAFATKVSAVEKQMKKELDSKMQESAKAGGM